MSKRTNTDRPISAYLAELARDARRSAGTPRSPIVIRRRRGRGPRGPMKPAGA